MCWVIGLSIEWTILCTRSLWIENLAIKMGFSLQMAMTCPPWKEKLSFFFVLFDINLPENFSTPELCLKGNVQNSHSQMSYYITTVHTYIHFPGFHDIGYVIFYRYTVQKLSWYGFNVILLPLLTNDLNKILCRHLILPDGHDFIFLEIAIQPYKTSWGVI